MFFNTRTALCALLGLAAVSRTAVAFNALSHTNVVNYWGQNSVSATGGNESSLATYCQGDTIDVFAIAFISQIVNGEPILNLSDHCGNTFANSSLLDCPQVGEDIKTCQANGKALVISIGGASGSYSIDTASAGTAFAEQVWDTFLGGSSSTRPFGDAVLDGVDLDLEAGTNEGYIAFIQTLRTKFTASSKSYYITAAPQCPYPDLATSAALDAAWFDLVWVQFYNNYCGVNTYGTSNFNFDQWDTWASTVSINKDVRVLLGVPGGPGAAGSGVVSASQLNTVLAGVKSYASFGGVMMWDAGIAAQSGLAASAASYLHSLPSGGSGGGSSPSAQPSAQPSPTTTTTTKSASKTTAPSTMTSPAQASPTPTQGGGGGSESCSAAAWNSATAYNGGAVVSYNGHTYTAQWWTQGNVPTSGAPWTDNGACSGTGSTPTPSVGCAGAPAWSSGTAYSSGAKVTYNGNLYTAQWWTQGDTPGTNSVWVQGAACTSSDSEVNTSKSTTKTTKTSKSTTKTSKSAVKTSKAPTKKARNGKRRLYSPEKFESWRL